MSSITRRSVVAGAAALTLGRPRRAFAAKNYDAGITDTEIKLGTTSPYSGPASGFGVYGQAQSAYFNMVNDRGRINGRKVNLLPLARQCLHTTENPRTNPQARRIRRGVRDRRNAWHVAEFRDAEISQWQESPELFLTSGAERFNDPKEFPWIVPFYPIYVAQSAAFGKYILKEKPNARIAVQYLNDDLGKDFLRGLKKGLGDKGSAMIVKEIGHELSEPSIDNQVADCMAAGADVFVQLTASKFAAQGIRKAAALNWHPLCIVNSNCSSIGGTLAPAGLDNAKGLISAWWEIDPTNPAEENNPAIKVYAEFLRKYLPAIRIDDNTALPGYNNAYMIEQVLKRCGDDLTRENLLKQATSLKDEKPPLYLGGIKVHNSATDYRAVHNLQLSRFDGKQWAAIGDLTDLDDPAT
jgi:ABC-type branched-subunit amino acid transport system substrate-binding protein